MNRIDRMRQYLAKEGLQAALVWQPENQYYYSRFLAISYSRPIVTLITAERSQLIVPSLESLHAKEKARVDHIDVYEEQAFGNERVADFPYYLKEWVKALGTRPIIGVDLAELPSSMYVWLTEQGVTMVDIQPFIIEMRMIKDAEEIAALDIAGHLSDIAVDASMAAATVGMSELEMDQIGDAALLRYATKHHPNQYIGYENWTLSGIHRSAMPHLASSTRPYELGDMVVHSRQVWYEGYRAENERTFFIGEPAKEHAELLKIAIEAQQQALDFIRPGVLAKEVDLLSFDVFKKAGVSQFVTHRIGHGLGLSEHEEPYLRFDNELVLQEGMVYTIEPGIYLPGLGGYRHSDTVIVTKTGSRTITNSPRSYEAMVIKQ